ncbi:hypothetical protein PFISCL1PPCAC_10038, partial [Pristionchus fissidentatus]
SLRSSLSPPMLILCLILILFLPPSLFHCANNQQKGQKPKTAQTPTKARSESNRSESTRKDSRRGNNKGKGKPGVKTRSISVAMNESASPSHIKQGQIIDYRASVSKMRPLQR